MDSPLETTPAAGQSRLRRLFYALLDRERVLGSVLLAPAVLYIFLLVGVPFFLAIAFAFSSATVGNPILNFVGFETFERVMQTADFQRALLNTFGFTLVSQTLVVVLAFILALALSQNFRGKWLFRLLILLPWATPIAIGAIGWLWLLDSVFSPLDYMLRVTGLIGTPTSPLGPNKNMFWLGPQWAGFVVVLVHVWRMLPMSTVILMAGLTSIPPDIRDAANVDGATFRRELFEVIIPMMRPITAVALLFGIVFTFADMTVVYVLTRGTNNTHVLASWAFFKGIEGGNLSEGAATAIFLLPVLVGVAALMLRLARRAEVA